jgi:general secretion pathway protein G
MRNKQFMKSAAGSQSMGRDAGGFTLIELLIVMVILGLLASLVAPQLFEKVGSSKVQVARTQIDMLSTSVDSYMLDVGRPPESLGALIQPDDPSWNGPYLRDDLPEDPWGNPFILKTENVRGLYEIISLGADGQEGGEDDDADLTGRG